MQPQHAMLDQSSALVDTPHHLPEIVIGDYDVLNTPLVGGEKESMT